MTKKEAFIRAAKIFGPDEFKIAANAKIEVTIDGAFVYGLIFVTNDQACICPNCGEVNWEYEGDPEYCDGCDAKRKQERKTQ